MAQCESIIEIIVKIQNRGDAAPETSIQYKMNGGRLVHEDAIVPTKQDLLNSL